MADQPASPTETDYARRIGAVLTYIQQNLDAAVSLDDLAAVAHFSPFHFHRIFRGMTGETVMQHVRRLRLERAAMRLRHTDRPITLIAFEAGYEAHESFTRAFRNAFGCAPSAFREQKSLVALIAAPNQAHFAGADGDVAFTPLAQGVEMDVRIRTLDPLRIASLRHTGPYDEVGQTWEQLMDWAGMNHIIDSTTRYFGACYDDPEITPPDKIRYDACITIDDGITSDRPITTASVPGGRFAVAMHEGPYDQLNQTYAALFGGWFARQRIEPADPPCFEFYLNEPDATPPEELLTEIWVRLQGDRSH